jgi:hypothetical protein
MKILDDYIELESMVYDEIDFIRDIDNEQEEIAQSVILSLVEYAFNQGKDGNAPPSYLLIDIKLHASLLHCSIERLNHAADKKLFGEDALLKATV